MLFAGVVWLLAASHTCRKGITVCGACRSLSEAWRPLQALVDDWGFAEAAFRQFAGPCFQHLATFLKSANELDSQLQASHAGPALQLQIDVHANNDRPGAALAVLPCKLLCTA